MKGQKVKITQIWDKAVQQCVYIKRN